MTRCYTVKGGYKKGQELVAPAYEMGNNNSVTTQSVLRKPQVNQTSKLTRSIHYSSTSNLHHRVSRRRSRSLSGDFTMSFTSKRSKTDQRRLKSSQIAAELAEKQLTEELLAAVIRGDEETTCKLLDQGTNVNSSDGNHLTALHYAAMHAKPTMIDILLNYGADANAYDMKGGFTPLHWVVINSRPGMSEEQRVDECLVALVKGGAKVDSKDFNQATPLHFAARTDNKAVVDALMRLGANPNEVDVLGRTCAAVAKSPETKILIIKLADLRARAYYHVLELPLTM